MDRWVGKVAVVTGASAGIGAAITKQLLQNSIKVVALDLNTQPLENYELQPENKNIANHLYPLKCDLRNEDEIIKSFKWIDEHLSAVHILINNAGVCRESSLMSGSTDIWKQTIDINLLAVCICTREALKLMEKYNVNDGHIFHMNSIAGHKIEGFPTTHVYSGTKHAITALSQELRCELSRAKKHIKVTSISPGATKTNMMYYAKDGNSEMRNKALFGIEVHMEPEDVGNAILYSLSTPEHVLISEITIKPIGT